MKICIIYSFKSELYIKNTFLKREFSFLFSYPVSAYWINLNLIRVKNLRSSRGGCR